MFPPRTLGQSFETTSQLLSVTFNRERGCRTFQMLALSDVLALDRKLTQPQRL